MGANDQVRAQRFEIPAQRDGVDGVERGAAEVNISIESRAIKVGVFFKY